jgi:hypothetical protein
MQPRWVTLLRSHSLLRKKAETCLLAFLPHKQPTDEQDEHNDDEHDESIHNYSFRSDPSPNELSKEQHTPKEGDRWTSSP